MGARDTRAERRNYDRGMKIGVIIPAAGASARYRSESSRSKLDEDLGGKSVLQRSVELFTKLDSPDWTVTSMVVAGPAADEAFAEFRQRYADKLSILGVSLVRGGLVHRWETVKNALAAVAGDCTHIAVHDAARPCTPMELIERLFDAAKKHAAVVAGVPVADTIKRTIEIDAPAARRDPLAAILGDDAPSGPKRMRLVETTLERADVYAIQTPQVFRAELLRRAYAQGDLSSTDDASLVERLLAKENPPAKAGCSAENCVVVLDGDPRNMKITRAGDLRVARAILGVSGAQDKPAHRRF